jgi:hypothetical protein
VSIPVLVSKPGVLFTVISPAGFHILWAVRSAALTLGHDITITSACDGLHSGPDDPHHLGQAYDLRTHDLPDPDDRKLMLDTIMSTLGTAKFYGFIEDPDTGNEHIHVQLRHGIMYP